MIKVTKRLLMLKGIIDDPNTLRSLATDVTCIGKLRVSIHAAQPIDIRAPDISVSDKTVPCVLKPTLLGKIVKKF